MLTGIPIFVCTGRFAISSIQAQVVFGVSDWNLIQAARCQSFNIWIGIMVFLAKITSVQQIISKFAVCKITKCELQMFSLNCNHLAYYCCLFHKEVESHKAMFKVSGSLMSNTVLLNLY